MSQLQTLPHTSCSATMEKLQRLAIRSSNLVRASLLSHFQCRRLIRFQALSHRPHRRSMFRMLFNVRRPRSTEPTTSTHQQLSMLQRKMAPSCWPMSFRLRMNILGLLSKHSSMLTLANSPTSTTLLQRRP